MRTVLLVMLLASQSKRLVAMIRNGGMPREEARVNGFVEIISWRGIFTMLFV